LLLDHTISQRKGGVGQWLPLKEGHGKNNKILVLKYSSCSIIGIQNRGIVTIIKGRSKWQTCKTLIWGPLSFLSITPKICLYAFYPLAWTHERSKSPRELVTNPECKRQVRQLLEDPTRSSWDSWL
jgi:hypothetical protein